MRTIALILVSAFVIVSTGCLSVGYKEYRYTFNPDGSGQGSVRFINLVSSSALDLGSGDSEDSGDQPSAMEQELDAAYEEEPPADPVGEDFRNMIASYIEGNSWEDENPTVMVTGKRLYEENGKLNGEITFTFNNAGAAGFYRDASCQCSPFIYYLKVAMLEDEKYESSNGTHLGDTANMPIILFNPYLPEFVITTKIAGDEGVSLLDQWRIWENSK